MTTITREDMRSAIVRAVRDFVGNDGVISVKDLAAATGISERTIKGYQCGPNVPPTEALMAMMLVIGPAFSDRILNIVGQGGVFLLADNEHADPMHLAESANGLAYEVTSAAAKGKFCHRAINAIRIRAHSLMARCNGFLWRHRRAAV